MRRSLIAAFLFAALILAAWLAISGDILRRWALSTANWGSATRLALTRLIGVEQELSRLREENLSLERLGAQRSSALVPQPLLPAELVFIDQMQPWPTRLILAAQGPLASGDLLVSGSGDALVGMLERAADGFAAARTLMSSEFELAVLGTESGASGVLSGSDLSGFFLEIRSAPDSPDFTVGEGVITAGVGFPRGLRVGTITSHQSSLTGAFRIHLLAPPFSSTLSEPLFVLRRSSLPHF